MITEPLITTSELENLYHRVMERAPALQRGRGVIHRGSFSSPFRGHGLEMADLRPYHWGDDLRHMDWRATARSGKPITKVFVDERMRHVFLVLDRSPSMAFGTRGRLKAAMAVHVAAVLAFSALAERETVAGAVFDGRDTAFFPVTSTLDGALPMLHSAGAALHAETGHHGGSPAHALNRLLGQLGAAVPSQATLFLISDFHGVEAAHLPALMHLAEHREVAAIHIVDPAEQHLSDSGLLRVVSPESGRRYVIDTRDAAVRAAYAAAMEQRHGELAQIFTAAAIPLLRVRTDLDPLTSIEDAQWATTH
jgi:uncharacterized protein (DUF58 family)